MDHSRRQQGPSSQQGLSSSHRSPGTGHPHPVSAIFSGCFLILALLLTCSAAAFILGIIPPPPVSLLAVKTVAFYQPQLEIVTNSADGRLGVHGYQFQPNEHVQIFVTPPPPYDYRQFVEVGNVRTGADGRFYLADLVLPFNQDGHERFLVARGQASGYTAPIPLKPAAPLPSATPTIIQAAAVAMPAATDTPLPPTSTPSPSPVPPTAIPTKTPIWVGQYYENRDLMGTPVATMPIYEWSMLLGSKGSTTLAPTLRPNGFSASWTTTITVSTLDSYLFELQADDGMRLYVRDTTMPPITSTPVINEWRIGPKRNAYGSQTLWPGRPYELQVDYFDYKGPSHVWISWTVGYLGWAGRYYNTTDFSGDVAYIRDDRNDDPMVALNFTWPGSPAPEVNPDGFSVSWERWIKFQCTCPYRFSATYDDGMRLYVGGELLFDQLSATGGNTEVVHPIHAGKQLVQVQLVERTGGAAARLSWVPLCPVPTAVPPELDP